MKIAVKLAFDEQGALRLLNWLAQENAIILRSRPDLPLLYDSGVVYRRETDETWCDYLNMLAQGHEDRTVPRYARAFARLRPSTAWPPPAPASCWRGAGRP